MATMAPCKSLPFPPNELMFMGEDEGTSIKNGDFLLDVARPYVSWSDGLVLDIGCGYGRLAFMRSTVMGSGVTTWASTYCRDTSLGCSRT